MYQIEVMFWNEAEEGFDAPLPIWGEEFETLEEGYNALVRHLSGIWWLTAGFVSHYDEDGELVWARYVQPGRGQIAQYRAMYGL
jgi:hypothetical protein